MICASCGGAMSPSFTRGKSGALYRYYRCQGAAKNGADYCKVGAVPAGDLEKEVLKHLRRVFQSPEVLVAASREARAKGDAEGFAVDHPSVVDALRKIDAVWDELYPGEQTRAVSLLVDHIEVGLDRVAMTMKARGIEHLLGAEAHRPGPDGLVEVVLPVVCRRRSGRTRVISVAHDDTDSEAAVDEQMEQIARAFVWSEMIESGLVRDVSALSKSLRCDEAYVRRLLSKLFTSPEDLKLAMLMAKQPNKFSGAIS